MELTFASGTDRKQLVTALSAITGQKATYLGMPSASYQVGNYIVALNCELTGPNDHALAESLTQQGFAPVEEIYDDQPEQPTEPEQPARLSIEVAIGPEFTPAKLANLERLVASKAGLLKKALGADALPIEQRDGVLTFDWFPTEPPENAMVYGQLCAALVRTALEATRITARERDEYPSERYALHCFLLKLGFIGPAYAVARKILLQNLEGDGSFARPKQIQKDERETAMQEQKYAVCEACGREMAPGGGCELSHIECDGTVHERTKVGSPRDLMPGAGNCGDCNAGPGQYHHCDCDAERCPVCGNQLLSCECDISFGTMEHN
jgi:hypothetical protein